MEQSKVIAVHEVFTTKDGNVEVGFFSAGFHGGREPIQNSGWRSTEKGERELVQWHNGRWVRDVELSAAIVDVWPTKPFPGHLTILLEEEERKNPR